MHVSAQIGEFVDPLVSHNCVYRTIDACGDPAHFDFDTPANSPDPRGATTKFPTHPHFGRLVPVFLAQTEDDVMVVGVKQY